MRIRVIQSGGVAGLSRESVVDTGALPPGARDELERKVEALGLFDLPARMTTRFPDVIQYRIHIEHRGQAREVLVDDQSASGELLAVVAEILGDAP